MIYNISYKTLVGAKPLRIRFSQVDGFIRVCDGNKYLLLFGLKKYDAICNKIRCLISQKSGITNVFFYNFRKIKIDSDEDFLLKYTDFA